MNTIISITGLLFLILLNGCTYRIPLSKPQVLTDLRGKKIRATRQFYIIHLQDTRGTNATYRDYDGDVGLTPHYVINAGDVGTITDFYKLPEAYGSFPLMNVVIKKDGQHKILECELHPPFRTPGDSLAEKAAYTLIHGTAGPWVLVRD